jgi:hypothetical protein
LLSTVGLSNTRSPRVQFSGEAVGIKPTWSGSPSSPFALTPFREQAIYMTVNPFEPPSVPDASMSDSSLGDDVRVLRYSVDCDDIMEFQQFHYVHSPTMRNQEYGSMGVWAMIAVVACLVGLPEFSLTVRLACAAVLAVVIALGIRALSKWSVASHTRQYLREGSNDGVIGDHELRIEENGLMELTSTSESRLAFSRIARIEETRDHAFIYISSLQAYVIPKNRIVSGDVVDFLARLRQLVP